MAARNPGGEERAKGALLAPRISRGHFFSLFFILFYVIFFRVTHDGLSVRGTTRSLNKIMIFTSAKLRNVWSWFAKDWVTQVNSTLFQYASMETLEKQFECVGFRSDRWPLCAQGHEEDKASEWVSERVGIQLIFIQANIWNNK